MSCLMKLNDVMAQSRALHGFQWGKLLDGNLDNLISAVFECFTCSLSRLFSGVDGWETFLLLIT